MPAKEEKTKSDYREELLEGQTAVSEEPELNIPAEPEVPEETVVEDEVSGISQETPATPTFVEQVSSLGFADVSSDDEARARLLDAWQKQQEELQRYQRERPNLEQFAEYGRQYVASLQQQPQQRTPEPAAPAEQPKPWWNPPQVELSWFERYREIDPATQEVRWKQNTPPEVLSAAQAYQRHIEDWATGLTQQPDKVLPPVIEGILREKQEFVRDLVRPLFEEFYGSLRETETQQQFISRVTQENADWLYEKDPMTNRPTTKLSRDGEMVVRFINEAQQDGITNVQRQWERAMRDYRLAMLETSTTEQQKSVTAQQAAQQMRQQHLRRTAAAQSVPSRGGSVQKPTDARPARKQNEHQSRGHDLLAQMEADGIGTT